MHYVDATLNIQHGNSHDQHMEDLDSAATFAHVIGLQEISHTADRHTLLIWLSQNTDWDIVGSQETPILYRKSEFQVIGHRAYLLVHGKAGENPDRVLNAVVFLHKESRRYIRYFNTHMEQRYVHAHKRDPDYEDRRRKARYQSLATTAHVMEALSYEGQVIRYGGDFNTSIKNQGEWWYPGALIGGAMIHEGHELDWFCYSRNVELAGHKRVNVNSDHDLQYVTVNL